MKKINRIDILAIGICLIIFLYSIFIGSPIKDNTQVINQIVLIVVLIYIIVKIFKEKRYKIIKRKIDIFVMLLVISSYIALIFKNYANLQATIEYAIKYTSILGLYIIIRDLVIKDKKYIGYIVDTILLSGVSIFLLGVDGLTYNVFEKIIKATNNVIVQNPDNRFLGIFGYANTTAIFMLIVSILAIGRLITCKGKVNKIFYVIVTIISIIAIVLSYSRGTWLIAGITYIILAIIYLSKKQNKINIKIKYVIVFGVIVILIIVILWNIGIKMTEPLVLFDNINKKENYIQNINNIQANTTYKIEFNIDAKVAYTDEEIYQIVVNEINRYDDKIKTHYINLGNFNGTKTLEFTTNEYTYRISIIFKTEKRAVQRGLTINELKINNEKIVLKYKYLPKSLVEKVQDIQLNTISVSQRTNYMKDTCKLILRHGILGIGADGWKDRIVEVQDYRYYAKEPHSYILEIFCEFGIVGFIAILGIVVQIILQIAKKKDIFQTIILIVILSLLGHSCIDFDLSFMYMLVILFTLIAMLEFEEKECKFTEYISKIIVLVILVNSIYFSSKINYCIHICKSENPYSIEYSYTKLDVNQEFSENIDKIVNRRKYISHANMFLYIIEKNKLNEEQYIKLYNIVKNEKDYIEKTIDIKISRIEFYKKFLNSVVNNKEVLEESRENLLVEMEEAEEILDNPEKNGINTNELQRYLEELERLKEG